jgi:hypothetical protein
LQREGTYINSEAVAIVSMGHPSAQALISDIRAAAASCLMNRQDSVCDRLGDAQVVYRVAEHRAGVEAVRFSVVEVQHLLLRCLVTSHQEIAMGTLNILQGTTSLRFTFPAGHCDLFLRAGHCSIKAEQLGCMPVSEMCPIHAMQTGRQGPAILS